LLSIAALLLASCGTPSSKPAASGPPPVEVTIATANNMLHTAEFVAVDKGFFLKHGVKANLKILNTGAEINKAMESQTAQFGGGSITAIPTARQAGLNLVLFAPYMNDATTSTDDNALAVVARADSGIRPGQWSTFVGKKVGLVKGGTGDEFLTRWFTQNGVDPKKVTYLNVQPGDQLVAIQQKSVDAVASWEPYQTDILAKLKTDAVLIQRGGGQLGYILGLESTDEYVAAHPDTVQKMTDALAETLAYIRGHLTEAATIATHYIPGLEVSVAADAIKNLDFDPRISGCTVKAFADSTKVLFDQKKLRSIVPAEKQVTTTFVTKTQQAHSGWYRDLKPLPAACSTY
jgi:ABC-type nitrate/sulfonate/bicarbonate transport system substrate-binding protein